MNLGGSLLASAFLVGGWFLASWLLLVGEVRVVGCCEHVLMLLEILVLEKCVSGGQTWLLLFLKISWYS